MADSLGILGKAAFVKDRGLYGAGPAIEYPDAPGGSDLAAGDQIPFTSESLSKAIERAKDGALVGSGQVPDAPLIAENCSGSIEGMLKWRGWENMVAIAIGFEHPDSSPATLAAGAYAHLFELDDALQDQAWVSGDERAPGAWSANDRKVRRGALAFDKQVSEWAWVSVMANKLTLSANPNEVKIAFDLIANALATGSYNEANWTLPSGPISQCLFQQMEIKLGARSVGAGSLPVVAPSSIELSIDNTLKGDDRTNVSGTTIIQPVRSNFREIRLKLEFPRWYSALDSILDDVYTDTEYAASIIFTGPQIAATGEYYKWSFFMSSLRGENPSQNIEGPGPLTHSIEFVAHRPVTTDIFEAGFYESIPLKKDSELIVMVQNEDSADYITLV